MGLGEMSELQRGEVKTAETLDELREYYLKMCANLYGERLLMERSYRAFDILVGDDLNTDYREIKSPRREDFITLTAEELSTEIETVETEYRERQKARKEMEANVLAQLKDYRTEAEALLPDVASNLAHASNRTARGR